MKRITSIALSAALVASIAPAFAEDVPYDLLVIEEVGPAPTVERYVLTRPGIDGNPDLCVQAGEFAEYATEMRDIGVSQFDVLENMRADAPDVDEYTFTRIEQYVMRDVYVPGERYSPSVTGLAVRSECEAQS